MSVIYKATIKISHLRLRFLYMTRLLDLKSFLGVFFIMTMRKVIMYFYINRKDYKLLSHSYEF